jgi:hypothetical protein
MGIYADYREVRKKYVIRKLEKKQQKYGRLRQKMRAKGLAVQHAIERVNGVAEDMLSGREYAGKHVPAQPQPTKAKK